jgi:hypothetical protein
MVSRGPANDSHVICAVLAALALDDMFARHALGHPSSLHPLLAYEQDTPFATFRASGPSRAPPTLTRCRS